MSFNEAVFATEDMSLERTITDKANYSSSQKAGSHVPKPQSNRFTAGQAIYVACPESKMKTSTDIGSSLFVLATA
jgi:hypothetical protein